MDGASLKAFARVAREPQERECGELIKLKGAWHHLLGMSNNFGFGAWHLFI